MNLPINRLRKIHILGPEKNRGVLDSLEIRCHICGEKIICVGNNWRVIKKAFIRRVRHHSWGHHKYEWEGKKKLNNNFQFEFPYCNITTEGKAEDTLWNQSLDDTHESLRKKDKDEPRKKGERYSAYRFRCNDCKATLENHIGEYCTECGSKNIDMIEAIDCIEK